MMPQEFKTQVFKTAEQWRSGLLYRLEMLKQGGITLYPAPALVQWIIQTGDGISNPAGMAVDECCLVYIMDSDIKSKACRLYRYDYKSQKLEKLSYIARCCSEPEDLQCPGRMILNRHTLWVNDTANHRVLAFSRENFQIKYILTRYIMDTQEGSIEPIDIGLDEYGYLYVLNGSPNKYQIIKYDTSGRPVKGFKLNLEEPVGLAIDGKGNLCIIGGKKLLIFSEKDSKVILEIDLEFRPSGITIGGGGNIFISDNDRGLIHQLDPDGSHIGIIPGFTGTIQGFTADSEGDLYISSNKGICKLSAQDTFTKEAGIYYSKTLDSGTPGCQWHRVVLQAEIPPKTILEVYYSSSDDSELKEKIDNKLNEKIPALEKVKFIEKQFEGEQLKWIGSGKNPKDMLFMKTAGRYLWLKLKLSTFDDRAKPAITQIKVLYPRISYLRYLPAIYQENPASKEFLERFLSIFETVSYDLETEINRIYEYFDPDTVPQDFISWLASWLNIALEESWKEDKKREFIREAYKLYRLKGTLPGIRKLVEMYTGKVPLILEHSREGKPMVPGRTFKLGIGSLLLRTPIRGFRLGDDSILGRVALRDTDILDSLEEPFLSIIHRFTIILDLPAEEAARYEKGLRRIIDEEKPAHTEYNIRFLSDIRERMGAYIGMSTKLDHYKPIRLGITATIGSGIITMGGEQGSRIGHNARVEQDTELI